MAKKAVIFTLDAILAILVAGSMITASFFYLSQENIQFNRQSLYKMALDLIAVLEMDGSLADYASTGSNSSIIIFISALPSQLCVNLTLYNNDSAFMHSTQKSNCNITQPVVSRAVFVNYNLSSYYAELKMGFD
jgi:hypothetical protein